MFQTLLICVVFVWAAYRLIYKSMYGSLPWIASGKLIVITGASSGIGERLAYKYASQGARLVLAARREKQLRIVSAKCENLGAASATPIICDVSKQEDCEHLMKEAGKVGQGVIDAIILNAGISMGEYFEDVKDLSIFRRLMEVNYYGCVDCTYYALPFLKKSRHGKIVAISSIAGIGPIPTRSGYSASKFALHGFFDCLRLEFDGKYPIDVTLICPGRVKTDINRTRLGNTPSQLDMSSGMSAADAADKIHQATMNGSRQVVFTLAGRLGQYVRFFQPGLYDMLVTRKFMAMQVKKKED